MSIFAGFGAVPEKFDRAANAGAVAGSIGAAVGAEERSGWLFASALSFLPHPVSSATASKGR